ncbi:MAG: TorF family putative porin [Methylotenera sp.]|uniref:TorF family putative porin n=1 Tax=Methylotenera sp. TaxID=2051956 RepID=UPI002488EBCA|nr:TorF family putative porin [Methylotenera sp.]MDI1308782.1 TorF family putative porin [Methylotenera sp.]
MRKSILSLAVLSALAVPSFVSAAEEAAEVDASKAPEPSWSVTTNVGVVSDYYTRGVSQSWHKPAVQFGMDVVHTSGFYAGAWGSSISPNTFPDASVELDAYAGYNGSISAVEGLGYTVGAIGYFYPGASWKKYNYLGVPDQTPEGGSFNTYEANFGLSYQWLSAKASVTLGDWFGAEKKTGWDGDTKGSTYIELNAAYPLPWYNLTLVGHVGHLNVAGELNKDYVSSSGQMPSATPESGNPDYTDYKIGLSKAFKIANSEGWNAGLYYVGNSNGSYWGSKGYGGSSFDASAATNDLGEDRFIVTLGRAF